METLENKILVSVNTDRMEEDKLHIQKAIFPAFWAAKNALQALGVGLDEKSIKKAISGQFSDIEKELFEQARKDSENLISQPAKDNLYSSVRRSLEWFKDELRKTSRGVRRDLLQYVSLKDGEPYISGKNERDLKKKHSQFIETGKGKAILEAQNEAVEALRKLAEISFPSGDRADIQDVFETFFDNDVRTGQICGVKLNYDLF